MRFKFVYEVILLGNMKEEKFDASNYNVLRVFSDKNTIKDILREFLLRDKTLLRDLTDEEMNSYNNVGI